MSFLFAFAFKGFRRCVQAAKQRAVLLSLDCVNGKYLWALPTPTTFEKVDQTFITATDSLVVFKRCHSIITLLNLNKKSGQRLSHFYDIL